MVKLVVVDRVSRAVVIVDDVAEFVEVTDGIGAEKIVLYDEILLKLPLGDPIFAFFLFPKGAGDCDVATHVVGLVCVPTDMEIVTGGFVCMPESLVLILGVSLAFSALIIESNPSFATV